MEELPPRPDYKLYTKDINPDKWHTKRHTNPLSPEYKVADDSFGPVDRSRSLQRIPPKTRRQANFIQDIEGAHPKRSSAITDVQRDTIMSGQNNVRVARGRNEASLEREPQKPQIQPNSAINQPMHSLDTIAKPESHYARFLRHKQQKQI